LITRPITAIGKRTDYASLGRSEDSRNSPSSEPILDIRKEYKENFIVTYSVFAIHDLFR